MVLKHVTLLCCFQISVDRGMTWDEAYNRSLKLTGPEEGFYLSQKVMREAKTRMGCCEKARQTLQDGFPVCLTSCEVTTRVCC